MPIHHSGKHTDAQSLFHCFNKGCTSCFSAVLYYFCSLYNIAEYDPAAGTTHLSFAHRFPLYPLLMARKT